MGWSITIGTVKGTVIRLHITFLLFLAWIAAVYYAEGGWDAAVRGILFIVLLFACVVLHEFGHIFAARRYGVQTPDVVLLPIGGVARLERIPEEPAQEIFVALAGPAVNVAIAAVLFLALGGAMPTLGAEAANPGIELLARLLWANLFIAVFNLIPAFPMDGGRVLRAFLARRYGYARGTQVASTIGQGAAFLFGLLGLLAGNVLLLFIALFVYLAAASEGHAAQMRQVSRGMMVADGMITKFESLTPASTVEDAVNCLIRTTQHEFPVVDGAGRLRGVLTRDEMIRALKEHGPGTAVIEVMRADIPTVEHRRNLDEALRKMQEKRLPAVGVTDTAGRLLGLITPENIGEMMMIQAAFPGGGRSARWRPEPPSPFR